MCYFSSRPECGCAQSFIISPWSSPPPRPLVLNSSAPDLICLMLFWPLLVCARSQCDQRAINERGRDLPGYRRNRMEFFRGTWDERWKISSQKKNKKSNTAGPLRRRTPTQKHCKQRDSPFTVRVTSLSATPIRGTMALQVYVPASSCVTAFSCRVLLLLSTLKGGAKKKREERQRVKEKLREPSENLQRTFRESRTHCGGGVEVGQRGL